MTAVLSSSSVLAQTAASNSTEVITDAALKADVTTVVLYAGTFVKKKAKTKGAYTIERRGEKVFLVLDDAFSTKKAPDLKIYLSHMPIDGVDSKNALKNDAVFLTDLESRKGKQEYELPADLDLGSIKTILVHCLKYKKLFGAATVSTPSSAK